MKTTDELYINRKKKEINLIGGKKSKFLGLDYNIETVFAKKNDAIMQSKSDNFKKLSKFSNTNTNHKDIKFDSFLIKYEYQRYDIHIMHSNFLKLFYNIDNIQNNLFYTNCGMSALFATFRSLVKLGYSFVRLGNIYVETERMIGDYIDKHNAQEKALFIDSSNFDNIIDSLGEIYINDFNLIIFDTTNYIQDDLQPIINLLIQNNRVVILVRSHMKLDMLGTEWATLGSICILNESNIFKNNELSKEIKIILSFIGGFAYPHNIPCFWNKEGFKELTYSRTENIKSHAKYLYNKLIKQLPEMDIVLPEHKLFVIFKLNQEVDYLWLNNEIDKFIENTKQKSLLIASDSFGFDYFAINVYFVDMASNPSIRVSIGDVPSSVCENVQNELVCWLKYINKKVKDYGSK